MSEPPRAHAILFTNLDFALMGDIHANAKALVLQADRDVGGKHLPRYKARAFGPSASWPVFQIVIPTTHHKLTDSKDRAFLHVLNGPTLTLIKTLNGDRSPISVDRFEAQANGEVNYGALWNMLEHRVRQFWAPGTNIPSLVWEPR